MSKSVVYIDTEDDITSIIDRVKASESDIVALVPPKRIGVLQSIVNLKLLQRGAAGAKKRVVLITNDQSLQSLAGGVKIPTAKNLQSRPEVAAVTVPETDDDNIIKGEDMSVGDMDRRMGDGQAQIEERPAQAAALGEAALGAQTASNDAAPAPKKTPKSGPKVPNFSNFRKRLLLGGGLAILLAIFLYWALWLAPHATVAITAQTESVSVDRPLSLAPDANAEDLKNNTLSPVTEQVKKTASQEFAATGKKTVGKKADGTAVISNCETDDPITIKAGTALSANGLNFITASSVQIPGGEGNLFTGCTEAGRASVKISAQDIGDKYNVAGGTQFAVAGFSDGVRASTPNGTSGGSKRQITVVSEGDVAAARQKLADKDNGGAKQELTQKFNGEQYVISQSFQSSIDASSVSPGVGEEADKATLTVETTYTLSAVGKQGLGAILDQAIQDEVSNEDQKKIYDNGLGNVSVAEYQDLGGGQATMRVRTTGYVGAQIDESRLKTEMRGKQYGEIKALVNKLPNVKEVNVDFSPFWVNSVSDKEDIDIKFEVKKNEQS